MASRNPTPPRRVQVCGDRCFNDGMYEPARILSAPFPERVRLICRTWASQVLPNPPIVLAMYWAKYLLLFIGGWAFFVSFSEGYPGLTHPIGSPHPGPERPG